MRGKQEPIELKVNKTKFIYVYSIKLFVPDLFGHNNWLSHDTCTEGAVDESKKVDFTWNYVENVVFKHESIR